jgi:hypothetical protein
MPRTPWSVNIAIPNKFFHPDGTFVSQSEAADGWHAEETVTGISRRKPVGWIPPEGYTMFHKTYRRAEGSCLNVTNSNNLAQGQLMTGLVGSVTGGRFNSLAHFDQLCSETFVATGLTNQALIGARIRLKETKINLGVAFGERNQTARLLGDTATRIYRTVKSLKRGEIRNAMRHLGISSRKRQPRGSNWTQNWLELQYGWKPLLSDVYGAAAALNKRPKSHWRVTSKASRKQRDHFEVTWSSTDAGYGTCEVESNAFVRIDALPQNEAIISLASMGITNPLSIGWELVPFSFVVDWALPVGKYLESLDAMLGYESAYASISLFTKMKWDEKGRFQQVSPTAYRDNRYAGQKTCGEVGSHRFQRCAPSIHAGVKRSPVPWTYGQRSEPNGSDLRSWQEVNDGFSEVPQFLLSKWSI